MSTVTGTRIAELLQKVCAEEYDGQPMEMALDWRINPTNLYRWLSHGVVPTKFQYLFLIAERTGRSVSEIAALAAADQGKAEGGVAPLLSIPLRMDRLLDEERRLRETVA